MFVRAPDLWEVIGQSDHSPICAFDHEYRLIGFNQAHSDEFFRIFNYRVQLGDVFPDLFMPEQRDVIRGFMRRALDGEVFNVTEEFGDPDLFKPYWEIFYAPLRDKSGRVIGAFHHAKDISDRLRAEAALRNAEDAMRQSQKMEAVGHLTGGVAHDFNNLLTIVKSAIEMLKLQSHNEKRRERYIGAIDDAVSRGSKLTQQLLAFARRQTLKPEVFDATANLAAMNEMIGTLSGTGVQIVNDVSHAQLCVNADSSQFDTALVNLVVNARDAMEGTGLLTIGVHSTNIIPALRERPAVHGQFVAVTIHDTGCGVPMDDRERIFEPFYTTKGVGAGTGLGLSQVFGFARQSGGDIQIESCEGVGSTFTLYLPRVAAFEPALDIPVASPVAAFATAPRVLVVEDNADVASSTVDALDQLGFETDLAANGIEGLERITQDPDRYDIVFSDVVMPGMTGVELGLAIRRSFQGIPVVLASGYSHVLAAGGTQGFELIQKPYSIDDVAHLLRRVISQQKRSGQLSGERPPSPMG